MASQRKKWTPKTTHEGEDLRVLRAFVDTRLAEADPLAEPASFKAWLLRHRLVDDDTAVTHEDAENARTVREGLWALLAKSSGAEAEEDAVRRMNAALGEVPYRVRFAFGSGRREAIAEGWPLVRARFADAVLAAMADRQWRRLKLCPECGQTFFDTSSNGSRKWCSATCSSRTTSRSFRRRHPVRFRRYASSRYLPGDASLFPGEE